MDSSKYIMMMISCDTNISRGCGNFMRKLLESQGRYSKAEVSRLFTRAERCDERNERRVVSKGELLVKSLFKQACGHIKRRERSDILQEEFGEMCYQMLQEMLEDEMAELHKLDVAESKSITPEYIRSFDFERYCARCKETCPMGWRMIRDLCGKGKVDVVPMQGERRTKSRDLGAMMVFSAILHARSNDATTLPKMMGLGLTALHVPKRAISLLGRLGITVSYSTVTSMLKEYGTACMTEAVGRVSKGEPFGVVYDNLVFMKRTSAESVLNKECLEKMTVNAIFFLKMPPRERMLRSELYDSLVGLPREICFNAVPKSVTVLELLGLLNGSEYWRKEAVSQVRMILRTRYPKETFRTTEGGGSERASYRLVKVRRADMMVGPTLDIDPGTLPGNWDVVEAIGENFGFKEKDLYDRLMPWNGDLFTSAMQNSLKILKTRDSPECRMRHVDPWPGYLHAGFAQLSAIAALHMGDSKKPWESFSLGLFIVLLGRSKLAGPKPPYHALHNFVQLIRDGCVLADIALELGVSGLGEAFRSKLSGLSEEDLRTLEVKVAERLMNLNAVGKEREFAEDLAWKGFVQGKCKLARSLSKAEKREKKECAAGSAPNEANALVQEAFGRELSDPERDLAYENMRLFVNHASVYLAFYEHCRSGDTGGLEQSLNIQTMFFQGAKKPKYAAEWLRQAIKRKCFWSDEYKEI